LVVIEIFNLIGQRITLLTDEYYKAGYHELTWNGEDLNGDLVPSGVYLYRIYANEFMDTKKMILLR
jgi:flagellar hook assembly protein FlgD